MRSGITRRWLQGSLLITVLLVLLVEVMFLYSTTRSYYNGVQQTMYRRFSSITGQLKMYTGETSQKTAASRSVALRRMVEQFSDKDKYEFMLLDSYGGVIAPMPRASSPAPTLSRRRTPWTGRASPSTAPRAERWSWRPAVSYPMQPKMWPPCVSSPV